MAGRLSRAGAYTQWTVRVPVPRRAFGAHVLGEMDGVVGGRRHRRVGAGDVAQRLERDVTGEELGDRPGRPVDPPGGQQHRRVRPFRRGARLVVAVQFQAAPARADARLDRPVEQTRVPQTAGHVGHAEVEACLVDHELDPVRGVDGAHDDRGATAQPADRRRIGHPFVDRVHDGGRRVPGYPVPGGLYLRPADVVAAVGELPREVLLLDGVEVDQPHPPDTESDQRLKHAAAEPAGTEQQDVGVSTARWMSALVRPRSANRS